MELPTVFRNITCCTGFSVVALDYIILKYNITILIFELQVHKLLVQYYSVLFCSLEAIGYKNYKFIFNI